MCSWAPGFSLPPTFFFFFHPSLLWSGLLVLAGISDYITNRWGGMECQGHWVCEGSWLTLPTESIACQFERVPALVLLELSSTPAGAQILPVSSRWITETLFSWLSIHRAAPHQGLFFLRIIYQHSLYSDSFSCVIMSCTFQSLSDWLWSAFKVIWDFLVALPRHHFTVKSLGGAVGTSTDVIWIRSLCGTLRFTDL